MSSIEFGTDGWRSRMDKDFNQENIRIVGKAISNYLKNNKLASKSIIIGYDTRKNSRAFAEEVTRVLIGNGIPVKLTVSDVPTPVVAYSILHFNTGGGVMITASHNPPKYNGIKFIPYYASPAMPEITDKLMNEIDKIVKNREVKNIKKFQKKLSESDLYQAYDPLELYIEDVLNKLNIEKIKKNNYKVVIDPLYGTARNYLEPILKRLKCDVYKIHSEVDPNFGGRMPNPNQEILKDLSDLVIVNDADIGMACDGDGDRSGIIDGNGKFIDANNLFAMLFKYYIDQGFKGNSVRTVSTTHLIDRIAEDYDLEVHETPVGSKYIGLYMREKNLIIGGESSGGLMFRGHIPEKDGIFTNMKVLEMMAYYNKNLSTLYEELIDNYGEIYFKLENIECKNELKDKVLDKLSDILPERFAGLEVVKKIDIDGFKFILEDNSWLLIRKSGTEPLLRLYCESQNQKKLKILVDEGTKFLIKAQKQV
ncbi:MAG: phosphoglucomutase/phosphomannomutase family protein [Candidatus Lokiarchaeota archaeon]|nr:phosphoglucomutase/phosphomannomutase family protein [Candidatus Lokiarchaeota archaeon]